MKNTAESLAVGPAPRVVRGAVLAYLGALVILPLTALVVTGLRPGPAAVWQAISSPAARHALVLTLWTAALVAAINAVAGTATAWVLVRYRFPGRRALSALVDLPFAIPTLVAGLLIVLLFGPNTSAGGWLAARGVPVLFAPPAIVLALLFITVPFVVRAVEPILLELDPAEEEAATLLGASPVVTFLRVILPGIAPAIGCGMLQSFSRSLAEFGSIVIVSGNIPHSTMTMSVLVFGEVEAGRPAVAAAVSVLLLSMAFALSLATRRLRSAARRPRATSSAKPA